MKIKYSIYFILPVVLLLMLLSNCNKSDNTPTPQLVPVVTTSALSNLTPTIATSGGAITSVGSSPILSQGVCWATTSNPTVLNNTLSSTSGTGSFTSNVTGLTPNTTYYLRAYATNKVGTGYGTQITFKTYTGSVTDIDGNLYYTVTIGGQIWMEANLKVTKFNDGTAIPNVTDAGAWSSSIGPAYCWYNNDLATYGSVFGALYNVYAVADSSLIGGSQRYLAPTGWHVATLDDWNTLTTYLGGLSIAGGKLKEAGTAHWLSPNYQATNETEYTALPGGERLPNGSFSNIYVYGYWWDSKGIYEMMSYGGSGASGAGYGDYNAGYSVRCVKD